MRREEFLEKMDLAPNHQHYISCKGRINSVNLEYKIDRNFSIIEVNGNESELMNFLYNFDVILHNGYHNNELIDWIKSDNKKVLPFNQFNLTRELRVYYKQKKITITPNVENTAKEFYFNALIAPTFYKTLDEFVKNKK